MAKKHWTYLLEAEAASLAGVHIEALSHIHWRLSPVVRLVLLSFEHDKSQAMQLMKALCKTMGDSRLIEVAHQQAKDLLKASKSDSFSNIAIMKQILSSQILEKYGCGEINSCPESAGIFSQRPEPSCEQEHESIHTPAPKEYSGHDAATKRQGGFHMAHTHPSRLVPKCGSHQVADALFRVLPGNIECCGHQCLMAIHPCPCRKIDGTAVRISSGQGCGFCTALLLSMASDSAELEGDHVFLCEPDRDSLLWLHITDIHDWVMIPSEPVVVNSVNGPLGWKKAGDPLPLEMAVCMENLQTLGVSYIKRLIEELGGAAMKGNPSRKAVEETLFKMVFEGEGLDSAWKSYQNKASGEADDDGIDSDFSETLSELDQEEGNQNDIKDLKAKKKAARLKRKMKGEADGPVQGRKKKGKGKGKGRGKGGKGKAKGEKTGGKKRKNFLDSLIDLAMKRAKGGSDLHLHHKLQRQKVPPQALPSPAHQLMSQCQVQAPALPNPNQQSMRIRLPQALLVRTHLSPSPLDIQPPRPPAPRSTSHQKNFCPNWHHLGAQFSGLIWTLDSPADFPPTVAR